MVYQFIMRIKEAGKSAMPSGRHGFTLIELLVAISIIAILVAVTAAGYTTAQKRGRDSKRLGDIKAIQQSLEQCYVLDEEYPSSISYGSSLECGTSKTVMNIVPVDPKNTDPYVYTYTASALGQEFCVCAYLEKLGSGNATTVGAGGVCSFSSGPDNDYQCLSNQQ